MDYYGPHAVRAENRDNAVKAAIAALRDDLGAEVALYKLNVAPLRNDYERRECRGRVIRRICQEWKKLGKPFGYIFLNGSTKAFIEAATEDGIHFDRELAKDFLRA